MNEEEAAATAALRDALKIDKVKFIREFTTTGEDFNFKFEPTTAELPEEIQYECPILTASVFFNAIKCFNYLAEGGSKLTGSDAWQAGALHMAARMGHIHFLQNPVFGSANFSCRDWRGQTPAHYASAAGHLDCLRFLIEDKGCEINSKDNFGFSLLHTAFESGQIPVIQYLLGNNPEITADCLGRTPLGLASEKGQIEVLRLIAGDYPDLLRATDSYNRTILHFAAASGMSEEIEFIKSLPGLDPNALDAFGLAPIHYAAAHNFEAAVSSLLTFSGLDRHLPNGAGDSAIHIAADLGAPLAVSALISPNPDDNSPRNASGKTPLVLAVATGIPRVVFELVRAGATGTGDDRAHLKELAKGPFAGDIKRMLDGSFAGPESYDAGTPYAITRSASPSAPETGGCAVA
jgi:ankyrin repeat protein